MNSRAYDNHFLILLKLQKFSPSRSKGPVSTPCFPLGLRINLWKMFILCVFFASEKFVVRIEIKSIPIAFYMAIMFHENYAKNEGKFWED